MWDEEIREREERNSGVFDFKWRRLLRLRENEMRGAVGGEECDREWNFYSFEGKAEE